MNENSNKIQPKRTYYLCEIRKFTNDDTATLQVNVIDWLLESFIVFANENHFNITIVNTYKK